MAKFEFRLPDIGEGVTEGEVVSWLVNAGDSIEENQDMVEVMTDKATVTISAPKAGRIAELRANPGDVVPVGSVLVVFDVGEGGATEAAPPDPAAKEEKQEKDEEPAAPAAADAAPDSRRGVVPGQEGGAQSKQDEGPAASAVGDIKNELPGTSLYAGGSPKGTASEGHFTDKPLASPATRKLAREQGIDLRRVPPSGKSGQVTREDIERYQQSQSGAAPQTAPQAASVPKGGTEERAPIRGLRKRIFENMARSTRTAAHFTYVEECDVTALMELHQRTRELAAEHDVKVTYLPFILKAVVGALKKHPQLHCLVDDAAMEMVYPESFDIGIAMATESGLIVPVIRGADRLSVLQIAVELNRLATTARAGKTRAEDLGGSSFTITSLGKEGGLFATPVINYPEVAILGVHEIKKRPVVKDDQIVVGQVMLLSLSFDHRIIDGHVGAAFAKEVIRYLEAPDRMFIDG